LIIADRGRMKLKRACIKGLNDKVDCNIEFHDDINIVTGINGSGKTTLLKMLWYAISGNIERLISEINFESFKLETSYYDLSLNSKDTGIDWEYAANDIKKNGQINLGEYNPTGGIESFKSLIIESRKSSLFFPTFRRIEGGYSMVNDQTVGRIAKPLQSFSLLTGAFPLSASILQRERDIDNTSIKDEFTKLSNRLSIENHKFICAMSTHDLGTLLSTRHAEISEKINKYSVALNNSLVSQIEGIKSGIKDDKQESIAILSRLQQEITTVNDKREQLFQPFKVLSELVTKVLHYKGIKLDTFTLGDSIDAIDSKLLSAGEQQMLSFLCYNAFYENSVIFIDEPELSLHPDWQRRLFPNLMKQQSSNQFIVATHSPLIYSKYSDKEIILSEEKGE
jgi:predicted ATPase